MPSLKDATKKPANVGEQIPVPAAQPVSPPVPPYIPNPQPGLGIASLGPPPAVFCDSSDSIRNFTRPGVSQSRLLPMPTKANPQANAQASSVASKQLKPVQAQTSANTTAIAQAGAQPAAVTGLAVSKSVFKDSTGVLHQAIELSFTPPATSSSNLIGAFAGISIWITEPGNEPVGVPGGTGLTSPIIFLLPINGNTVTLTVQSYSVNGVDNDFSSCPTISVLLDGATTPPAAPTIASGLAPCNSGVTFSWNIVADPLHDVIDCYRVYRNTVNNSATATLVATTPQPATGTGTNVFTDVQPAGAVHYYWVSCENLQQLESTLTAAQSGAVQSGAVTYRGAYAGGDTYNPGDDVTYSGQFYTCILQSTGNLPTNATYWQNTGSSSADVFLGAWVITTPYVAGNQVTYSSGYYIAIASTTGDQPDISPTKWQIVGSVSTYIFLGAYNGGTAYVPGNQVTYLGSYWMCISSSTGNAPSTASSFWVLVGTGAILLGAWNSGVTYVQGNEVTLNGDIYTCILTNLNHTPPNSTYWQLVGNFAPIAQGKNALYNGDFELNAGGYPVQTLETVLGTYISDGWNIGEQSTFQGAYLCNAVEHGGNLSLAVRILNSSVSLPSDNTYRNERVLSSPIPVYAGMVFNLSGWIYLALSGGVTVPSGGDIRARLAYYVYDQNGNQLAEETPFADVTAAQAFTQVSGQVAILSAYGGTPPSYIRVQCSGFVKNNSGSAWVTTGAQYINAIFDDLAVVPVTNLGTDTNDGPANFSATASTLTYRPLTNPLTATDAGSNATISIAAFTMRTSSKGDISENSGSITTLSYSTLYYIYFDDPTLAGGAVTYAATTTKTTAINGVGRFFVGSIITPKAGAPDSIGNSDGGVGAQNGSTSVFLFGTVTEVDSSGGGTLTNPAYMIDGDLTTFGTWVEPSSPSIQSYTLTLAGTSPTSAPWSSLTIYFRYAVPTWHSGCGLSMSVAGNVITPTGTVALTTASYSLPVNTNLALINIQAAVVRASGSAVSELDIYGAWVVGII